MWGWGFYSGSFCRELEFICFGVCFKMCQVVSLCNTWSSMLGTSESSALETYLLKHFVPSHKLKCIMATKFIFNLIIQRGGILHILVVEEEEEEVLENYPDAMWRTMNNVSGV